MNQREVWGRRICTVGFVLIIIGGVGGIVLDQNGHHSDSDKFFWLVWAGMAIVVVCLIWDRRVQDKRR